jgi:hypothetical protein
MNCNHNEYITKPADVTRYCIEAEDRSDLSSASGPIGGSVSLGADVSRV